MNLTQAVTNTLKAFRRDVPDYLAGGMVDMSTEMLLGVETVHAHPQEILDVLAAATADMFQGRTVVQIEDMFRKERRMADTGHYFKEILIYSDNLVHLFLRSQTNVDIVAAIICRKDVNVGMLFAKARRCMREFDDEVR